MRTNDKLQDNVRAAEKDFAKARQAFDRDSRHAGRVLSRRGVLGEIQAADVLWRGADQETLRQFLPDARLRISRFAQGYLARAQKADARQIVFQFHGD